MALYQLGDQAPRLPDDGSAFVAPDARVIGKVVLGAGASIWFSAVLRGDNETIEIGAGANIQDGCVIHTDPGFPCTVGQNCTVGHRAILHGCTVEVGALIGMGATVLNGAVIGAGSLVGANALVTEGKVFPPRSLIVGAPAKVIRQLDDATVRDLARTAQKYVQNGARFASTLSELEAGGTG